MIKISITYSMINRFAYSKYSLMFHLLTKSLKILSYFNYATKYKSIHVHGGNNMKKCLNCIAVALLYQITITGSFLQDIGSAKLKKSPGPTTQAPQQNDLLSQIQGAQLKKPTARTEQIIEEAGPTKFKDNQAYKQAELKAEQAAELQARKPMEKEIQKIFDESWPDIEAEYRRIRQEEGFNVLPENIIHLRTKTRLDIERQIENQYTSTIEAAKEQARADFKMRYPKETSIEPVIIKIPKQHKISQNTAQSIRTDAQNAQRDAIINPKLAKFTTQQHINAWQQDFIMNFERTKFRKPSADEIKLATENYIQEHRTRLFKNLTLEEKRLIEQAGQQAVDRWHAEQHSNSPVTVTAPEILSSQLNFASDVQTLISKTHQPTRPEKNPKESHWRQYPSQADNARAIGRARQDRSAYYNDLAQSIDQEDTRAFNAHEEDNNAAAQQAMRTPTRPQGNSKNSYTRTKWRQETTPNDLSENDHTIADE